MPPPPMFQKHVFMLLFCYLNSYNMCNVTSVEIVH